MEASTYELRWIDESKMLEALELARSTFQGWIKAGIVERSEGRSYTREQMFELALVSVLREHFSVDELALRWPRLQASGATQELVSRTTAVTDEGARCDLVVQVKHGGVAVATDDAELAAAVRYPGAPRPVVVVDLVPALVRAHDGFESWYQTARRGTERRPGRPQARRAADVRKLSAS